MLTSEGLAPEVGDVRAGGLVPLHVEDEAGEVVGEGLLVGIQVGDGPEVAVDEEERLGI